MQRTWTYLLVAMVVALMGSGVGLVLGGEFVGSVSANNQEMAQDLADSSLSVGGQSQYQIECDLSCRQALLSQ